MRIFGKKKTKKVESQDQSTEIETYEPSPFEALHDELKLQIFSKILGPRDFVNLGRTSTSFFKLVESHIPEKKQQFAEDTLIERISKGKGYTHSF